MELRVPSVNWFVNFLDTLSNTVTDENDVVPTGEVLSESLDEICECRASFSYLFTDIGDLFPRAIE